LVGDEVINDFVRNFLSHSKDLSVDDLVSEVSRRYGLPKRKAVLKVFRMYVRNVIDLVDINPPVTFIKYLLSSYSLWYWLFNVVVVLTIVTVLAVSSESPLIPIRYVLGSLYVLYIPGATLIEVLYPKHEDLSPLERLALSIGLSLALVPLVGLILNYTPWGIRLIPVTTSLALLSICLATVALYRKYLYHKLRVVSNSG